jgi:broad specificity phosphatase PhoE
MKTLAFGNFLHIFGAWTNLELLLTTIPNTEAFVPGPSAMRGKPGAMRLKSSSGSNAEDNVSKRIVFIRHGRTYMNDFINGINYGTPGFTDVFSDTPENNFKYVDSPLAPTGLNQVKALNDMLRALKENEPGAHKAFSLSDEESGFLEDLDLVVTSPLTRALQTLEMGLYEHIQSRDVPIVAVPQAAERIYLVSDHGKTRTELKGQYSFVDFDSGFDPDHGEDDPWHFVLTEEDAQNYVEWRPHGEGQVYAGLGEPQHHFDRRMSELYRWLESREESMIAVVCHAGVIDWMLQEIFENCELRVVNFENLKPRALQEVEEYEKITT